MNLLNLGTETAPKWLAVATVSIKGEEQDIIPAFTDYSIKQKDFSKDKVFTAMDKSKILPTIFCLTDAEVFIKENVKLFDYHGREIDELPEGAPRILVYLDKPDNINLWSLDIPIQFIVKKFLYLLSNRNPFLLCTNHLCQAPSPFLIRIPKDHLFKTIFILIDQRS